MGLDEYLRKRDFQRTPEPKGARKPRKADGRLTFTVQKHAARRLHYDFRLELDGVLLSWAVPKGPSLDPQVKRLAVQTEDHPLEYGTFEGVIPKGEYGGGPVLVWDRGRWIPEGDPHDGLRRGRLTFELEGEKLRGGFHLVRTRGGRGRDWLLIKRNDAAARAGSDAAVVDDAPESVLTGRIIDEVRSDPDRVWHSNRDDGDGARLPDPGRLEGARQAALPEFVEPQLATLVDAAPERGYLHEIKLDGYRMLARLDRGHVRLLTRKGNDWTGRLPSLARVFAALPFEKALFDGEVVVLGPSGVSDFQRLQNSLSSGRDAACLYYAFDLLHFQGFDLRKLPLARRKAVLHDALAAAGALSGRIRYSEHHEGSGARFLEQACKLGLEGMVSKRADAPYVSGRSRAWLKVKCHARQEFVIGGYTDPAGARAHFGALLLGEYGTDGRLRYAGKVGTGFSRQSLAELHAQLAPLEQKKPPFANPPRGAEARGVHWLRPKLVAEVEYAERTQEGIVRHASFRGLRQDKPAAEVRAERPAGGKSAAPPSKRARRRAPASRAQAVMSEAQRALAAVRLTNPQRVLYPELALTKRDVALYYAQVAQVMLPHVARRPLALVRCPEGQRRQCFYQKHPGPGVPDSVGRVKIREKKRRFDYMFVEDVAGLLGLVQVGVLEVHTWGSRIDHLECPDQLVFDLDPDDGLPWSRMIDAALDVRARLAALGLEGFVKTTGGKGLHVLVPIVPRTPWDEAKEFSKRFVEAMVRAHPARYVATMSKAKRRGKIFLDYLRNGRGATAVCAYSTRAKPNAPVSMPVAWEELTEALRSDQFTLRDAPAHVAARARDPWRDFDAARAPLSASVKRGVGLR